MAGRNYVDISQINQKTPEMKYWRSLIQQAVISISLSLMGVSPVTTLHPAGGLSLMGVSPVTTLQVVTADDDGCAPLQLSLTTYVPPRWVGGLNTRLLLSTREENPPSEQ